MLSMSLTQQEWIDELQKSYNESVPFGGNQAIKNHLDKVKAMDPILFSAHQERVCNLTKTTAAERTVARLVNELKSKGWMRVQFDQPAR